MSDAPRLIRFWWLPVVIAIIGTVAAISVAVLGATWWDEGADWPWYLLIVGTGIPFVAAASLPRPISPGPLLATLGALALWVYGAGIAVDVVDSDGAGLAPEAVSVFGVVIIGFFGVLFLPREGSSGGLADAAMRHAFGASFILGYFALASIAIFHEDWKPSDLGDTLATQITSLFGVVVVFYFASTGTVEYLKHRENQQTVRMGIDPNTGDPLPDADSAADAPRSAARPAADGE